MQETPEQKIERQEWEKRRDNLKLYEKNLNKKKLIDDLESGIYEGYIMLSEKTLPQEQADRSVSAQEILERMHPILSQIKEQISKLPESQQQQASEIAFKRVKEILESDDVETILSERSAS